MKTKQSSIDGKFPDVLHIKKKSQEAKSSTKKYFAKDTKISGNKSRSNRFRYFDGFKLKE